MPTLNVNLSDEKYRMKYMLELLPLCVVFILLSNGVKASESIAINYTSQSALLDGHCGNDEWESATQIELPAHVLIYLMHDDSYFYICAKGKKEDINVLDLYIQSAEKGVPHRYHLSAQMGESVLKGDEWEATSEQWVLKDYAGFWVPYSGLEDPENRKNPKFARGTHRQVQISRKKFAGNNWNMMFGVSAIKYKGEWADFFYPTKAVKDDLSTWGKFSFSEENKLLKSE